MPEYIDIHCHLNFDAYKEDRKEAIDRALDARVWMINVGTQQGTSSLSVQIAKEYKSGVYAIVGLHPIHTDKSYHDEKELGEGGKEFVSKGENFDESFYKKLAGDEKVLAIGECGLDYFRVEKEYQNKQKEAFIGQINLANSVKKPLMLHIREAYYDAYEILKSEAKVGGNLHFFAGNKEIARKFLDLGYYFSFTGVITFAPDYKELIEYIPIDRIMSETDSPYVSPVPYRGKRNEPANVIKVVEKISEIKKIPLEEVKTALIKNAFNFFNIPDRA